MLAYRVVDSDTLDNYKQGYKITGAKVNSILSGREFGIYFNNYNYRYDKRYLHFFRDLIDAFDYKKQREIDKNKEFLVISFDMPEEILKRYEGRGGYEFNKKQVTAVEYAIPDKKYNPQWFKEIISCDQIVMQREEVDYSLASFGFYGKSNGEIDSYIEKHKKKFEK